MKRGWHFLTSKELADESIDFEVAFRRDPDGLCRAVTKALNDLLLTDSNMNGWEWTVDWSNLPGAISVQVLGTAMQPGEWDCPQFFAATSVATYAEVDDAAKRLQERIQRTLKAWHARTV